MQITIYLSRKECSPQLSYNTLKNSTILGCLRSSNKALEYMMEQPFYMRTTDRRRSSTLMVRMVCGLTISSAITTLRKLVNTQAQSIKKCSSATTPDNSLALLLRSKIRDNFVANPKLVSKTCTKSNAYNGMCVVVLREVKSTRK